MQGKKIIWKMPLIPPQTKVTKHIFLKIKQILTSIQCNIRTHRFNFTLLFPFGYLSQLTLNLLMRKHCTHLKRLHTSQTQTSKNLFSKGSWLSIFPSKLKVKIKKSTPLSPHPAGSSSILLRIQPWRDKSVTAGANLGFLLE